MMMPGNKLDDEMLKQAAEEYSKLEYRGRICCHDMYWHMVPADGYCGGECVP